MLFMTGRLSRRLMFLMPIGITTSNPIRSSCSAGFSGYVKSGQQYHHNEV